MSIVKAVELINTWQGEGPDSGKKMTLIRFKECNRILGIDGLKMCPFCDTAMKLRVSTDASYDIYDIQKMINNTKGIMISGGEPGYNQNLQYTIDILTKTEYDVANVETNGYDILKMINLLTNNILFSKNKDIKIIYSPKFFTGEEFGKQVELTKKIISNPMVYIKLVNASDDTEDYLQEVSEMNPSSSKIWLMPEGKTMQELIANSGPTIDLCEKYNVNFSSRNHIIFGFV